MAAALHGASMTTRHMPWGPLTADEERELRARWSEFLDAVDPNYHPTGVVPRLLATLDAARSESPSPCRYCGSVSGETPPGAWQTDPLTGDALRRSINAACSLTNPQLSEVDWDAVAAVFESPSPEGLTEALRLVDEVIFDLPIGEDVTYSRGYSAGIAAARESLREALAARLRSSADSGPEGT
jgi:hypothetical protein